MLHIEEHKSRYLRLNSRDSHSETTNAFSFNITGPSRELSEVTAILVKAVSVPNIWPNVRNGQTFSYVYNGAPMSFVIPDSQYTAEELITYIEGIFFTQTTANLTISQLVDKKFYFEVDSGLPTTIEPFPLLGVTADISLPSSAQSLPAMYGVKNLIIMASGLVLGDSTIDAGRGKAYPILLNMPINAAFGEYEHYSAKTDMMDAHKFHPDRSISDVNITLYDALGDPLNLEPNQDIDITLKVFYH